MYHACSTPPIQNRKIHNRTVVWRKKLELVSVGWRKMKRREEAGTVDEQMDVHAALQQHRDGRQEDGDDQQEQIG